MRRKIIAVLMILFAVGCSAFAYDVPEIETVYEQTQEYYDAIFDSISEDLQRLIALKEVGSQTKPDKSQEQIIRERDCAIARFEAEEAERQLKIMKERSDKVWASIREGTLFQYDFNDNIHPFKELTVRVTSIKDEIVPFRTLMIKL